MAGALHVARMQRRGRRGRVWRRRAWRRARRRAHSQPIAHVCWGLLKLHAVVAVFNDDELASDPDGYAKSAYVPETPRHPRWCGPERTARGARPRNRCRSSNTGTSWTLCLAWSSPCSSRRTRGRRPRARSSDASCTRAARRPSPPSRCTRSPSPPYRRKPVVLAVVDAVEEKRAAVGDSFGPWRGP